MSKILKFGQVRKCKVRMKNYEVFKVGERESTVWFPDNNLFIDFLNSELEDDELISEEKVKMKVKMKIKVEETVEVELTKEELSMLIEDSKVLNSLFTADIYYYKDDNHTDKKDVGGDYQFEFVELV